MTRAGDPETAGLASAVAHGRLTAPEPPITGCRHLLPCSAPYHGRPPDRQAAWRHHRGPPACLPRPQQAPARAAQADGVQPARACGGCARGGCCGSCGTGAGRKRRCAPRSAPPLRRRPLAPRPRHGMLPPAHMPTSIRSLQRARSGAAARDHARPSSWPRRDGCAVACKGFKRVSRLHAHLTPPPDVCPHRRSSPSRS